MKRFLVFFLFILIGAAAFGQKFGSVTKDSYKIYDPTNGTLHTMDSGWWEKVPVMPGITGYIVYGTGKVPISDTLGNSALKWLDPINDNAMRVLTNQSVGGIATDAAWTLASGLGFLSAVPDPIVPGDGTQNITGSLTASGELAGSNLSGTNTGDQTRISGSAGSATQIYSSDDIITAGPVFPVWTDQASSTRTLKTSATKYYYDPVNGNLNSTIFTGTLSGTAAAVTGFSPTSGKILTIQKTITLTSPDDTSVSTLPAGTKTLLATDGSAASLTSFPTLNQDTTGTAGGLKSVATTGKITITGPAAASTRAKTVRDADDTLLELGGSYTPNGTWNWATAPATWPPNINSLNSLSYTTTSYVTMTGANTFGLAPGSSSSVVPANPTATVDGTVKNGSSANFMRSDAAPALADPITPADGTQNITGALVASGAISGSNLSASGGANPTATLTEAIQNGSATTFMRSDGAPALPQALASTSSPTFTKVTTGLNATTNGNFEVKSTTSGSYANFYMSGANAYLAAAVGGMYIQVPASQWFTFIGPGGFEMRSGGIFYWEDSDASNATRATLNTATGALDIGKIASAGGGLSVNGTERISYAGVITGTTVNGTTGINTGATAGTNRIDVDGNLVNIGKMNTTIGQTTTNGSLSGSVIWSQPFQGSSYKKAVFYLNGYADNSGGLVLTFPTAFTRTPFTYGDATAITWCTAVTTTLTINQPAPNTPISCFVFVEGY